MATKTEYPHIVCNELGVPVIEGTSMKVIELIIARRAYGWSPEELHFQYPHLTLSQIHSALAFYWDHTQELDKDVALRTQQVEALSSQAHETPSPLVQRIKSESLR